MMDFADSLAREATAFQSQRVESIGVGVACGHRFRKRQDVSGDSSAASDKRICPDAHEVVYRAERAYLCPVANRDVTTEGGGIGQQDVIADQAVMSDVRVSHDKRVIANACDTAAFHGTAVDGYELANFVVITDFQARRFVRIAQILGRHAG